MRLYCTRLGFVKRVLVSLALCCSFSLAQAASNHALILWIGEYGVTPSRDLPGIDLDASLARQMAKRMGVPPRNIRELSNTDLTRQALIRAVEDIEQSLGANDSLFVYFSGHGSRFTNPATGRCSEALMLRGLEAFMDAELEQILQRIGSRARQVVMFNDSCFSGGAAEKSSVLRNYGPSLFPKEPSAGANIKINGRSVATDPCTVPINAFLRNFAPRAGGVNRPNFVYLGAAAENEVSFATRSGSTATVAWSQCMAEGGADGNNSGAVTAKELNACAQSKLHQRNIKQTLSLSGKGDLPVVFPGRDSPVEPAGMFGDIAAGRDESIGVTMALDPNLSSYRIGQDRFRLRVTLDRPGFLYVYQAGSNGAITPLFPYEGSGENNRLPAGTHVLPLDRQYSYRSDGPAGVSSFIAVLTPENVDVLKRLRAGTPPTGTLIRNFSLQVEQTAAARWGASTVIVAREVE